MNRRIIFGLLVGSFFLLGSCRQEAHNWQQSAQSIRSHAIQYLLTQQQDDGSWRSETHGILKGGVAYTAYITDALIESDDRLVSTQHTDAAILFLLSALDSSGALGYTGKYVIEYPVYATAYLHKIFPSLSISFDTLLRPHFEHFLCAQQFTEARGISVDHPAYGAWGFGENNLPFGEVGHIDLSHTRRVLEALQTAKLSEEHPAWKQAITFLQRVQNEDGGFCSSSYTLSANKADEHDRQCVSYATTTADGLLALAALPHPPERSISRAVDWLVSHEQWDTPSGIKPRQPGDWDKVLHLYHMAVRAQAYAQAEQLGLLPQSIAKQWRTTVVTLLQEEQGPDGSFVNPWGAPNKEDDPLLGTALMVRALNAVLK